MTAKKCTKKRDARAKLLLNLSLFLAGRTEGFQIGHLENKYSWAWEAYNPIYVSANIEREFHVSTLMSC